MKNRLTNYILGAILLIAVTTFCWIVSNQEQAIRVAQEKLETNINANIHKAKAFLADSSSVQSFFKNAPTSTIASSGITFYKYNNDSLVQWSSAEYAAPLVLKDSSYPKIKLFGNVRGFFDLDQASGIAYFIPIVMGSGNSNHFYVNGMGSHFELRKHEVEGSRALKVEGLEEMLFLNASGFTSSKSNQWLLMGLFLMALFSFLSLMVTFSTRLSKQWGGFVLILSGALAYAIIEIIPWEKYFYDLPYFSPDWYTSFFNQSIGKIMFSALLLIWVVSVFYRRLGIQTTSPRGHFTPYIMSLSFYSVVVLALFGLIWFVKRITDSGGIDFNIGELGYYQHIPIMAIVVILLLTVAFFIFSNRMITDVFELLPQKNKRVIIMMASLWILLPLHLVGMPIDWKYFLLLSVLFLSFFDIYVENRTGSMTWLLLWLVLFSVFLALLMNHLYLQSAEVKAFVPDIPLSLFGLIFSLSAVAILLLSLLNYLIHLLPLGADLPQLWDNSLRTKIQLFVLFFSLLCFIAIGGVSYNFFKTEQLQSRLQLETSIGNGLGKELTMVLGVKDSLSEEEMPEYYKDRMAVYNMQGIRQWKGMHHPVGAAFLHNNLLNAINEEGVNYSIGSAIHLHGNPRVVLVKVFNHIKQPVGIVELPILKEKNTANVENAFVAGMFTVYSFLLLIASVISIFIANAFTEPLRRLSERLQGLNIDQNAPLQWKSDDEIGQLVKEYNTAIYKLAENAEILKQSEREGAWREMAKQVAHEIKNPLTPMQLNIQHLKRVMQSDPERAQEMSGRVMDTLHEQIGALVHIANEFSNFAKMPKPKLEKIHLNDLVKSTVLLFQQAHEDVSIHLQLPEKELLVEADRTQMIRVINNLIKNALQALEGEEGEINVLLSEVGTQAQIVVKDNGQGIKEEDKERIFRPNFTTKSSGTGLGLAMSKAIVESVSGRIYFESEVGEGTSFLVEVPVI